MQTVMNLFMEGAGIVFGSDGKTSMYLLLIQDRQQYCIMKLDGGAQSFVIPWTKSDLLTAGAGSNNTISIMGAAGSWRVALNGKPAATVPAQPFFGDAVGMMQAGNQANRFDDFMAREWPAK